MRSVNAGPEVLNSQPCAPGAPNGSAGLAVTGCFIAAPTSETVTRTQALRSVSTRLSGPSSAGGAPAAGAGGAAAGGSLRAGFIGESGGRQYTCTNGCCMAKSMNACVGGASLSTPSDSSQAISMIAAHGSGLSGWAATGRTPPASTSASTALALLVRQSRASGCCRMRFTGGSRRHAPGSAAGSRGTVVKRAVKRSHHNLEQGRPLEDVQRAAVRVLT